MPLCCWLYLHFSSQPVLGLFHTIGGYIEQQRNFFSGKICLEIGTETNIIRSQPRVPAFYLLLKTTVATLQLLKQMVH